MGELELLRRLDAIEKMLPALFRVLDIRDIFKDPHYIARQNIVSVPDGDFGEVRMQGVTPKFSRTPGEVRHSGGELGADNRAIFVDELGVSESEFAALQAQGVI